MSDYFYRLAARARGIGPTIEPLTLSDAFPEEPSAFVLAIKHELNREVDETRVEEPEGDPS